MSQLTEIIKAEIALQGAIPFARFMELALYCPDYGFYEKESDTVGRRGDFYTSVSVGSLFGELLAFQFAEWLEELDGNKIQIVEAGAHDGKLAADILRWLRRRRPHLGEHLEYVIAEPSARRRDWQRKSLAEFGEQVRWVETGLGEQESRFAGIVFSNELLDAMPVHRMGWDAKQRAWFEWGVAWEGGGFNWTRMKAVSESRQLSELPGELLAILPDGFTTEISPTAEQWWCDAAQALSKGRLLTLDYGLRSEEFFSPQRTNGTLRAYRSHKLCDDVLANPGEQDLTAHVNFSRIQAAGEQAGMRPEKLVTQSEFMVGIAKKFWAEAEQQGEWTAQRNREFQTLIHPEHLGRAFRVLVQSR
ncbi:MAG: SAM-dependent methyltransferase [Verrucomicrobiota bacterium]